VVVVVVYIYKYTEITLRKILIKNNIAVYN